jgi:dTMP kinase
MEPAINGKFIVLDGIDLCGKDTQARLLVDYLYDHPIDQKLKLFSIIATREPSGSKHTLEIRRIVKENTDPYEKANKLTELFVEDRKWHLDNVINPGFKAGCFVVSIRYMYSTLVFQQTQGIPLDKLLDMHKGMRIPDVVIFIDITSEESTKRSAKRTQREEEMFEKLEFQKKIRKNYLDLKEKLPDHPIHIINGERSVEEIQKEIREIVDKLIQSDYPKRTDQD